MPDIRMNVCVFVFLCILLLKQTSYTPFDYLIYILSTNFNYDFF